jgi:signal transduction histidine kinase
MERSSNQPVPLPDPDRRQPWYRRASARLGLQGKLLAAFFALLALALGASCWMFVSESRKQLDSVMGEHARQLASALAMASVDRVRNHQLDELRAMGQDLIKSRNILFVGFLNPEGTPTVVASRDVEFGAAHLRFAQYNSHSLMQVSHHETTMLGSYLQVVVPVLTPPASPARTSMLAQEGPRLVGYVAVGLSLTREDARLKRISLMVMGIGIIVVAVSVPLGFALVHRIFYPIRQLDEAARRITGGDLNARVAIDRPDIIGHLARSFNEMVNRVRQQQLELEDANQMLAQVNHDLEDKVEQRTAQLAAANERLRSEIAEKEDFLRAVSHDLNAPLRNISGMAAMLLMKHRDRLDVEIIERLERIQKNVDVETGLISELLELSRIKSRRQRMEPVEVEALVWELHELFESDLKSRDITLVIDTPLPVLNCERSRMRQVFQNLIDNAIKYMGKGATRSIHIGCTLRPREAEFYVRDTGMGIEKLDLDKVFFVFRRGKNSAGAQIPGKGVGLASVKSIVETYGGKIWVESLPGEGSTFRFTIDGKFVPASATAAADRAQAARHPACEDADEAVAAVSELE